MTQPTIFSQYPVASWQVGQLERITFSIEGAVREKRGNRVVMHKRPYRKGAKLDSTGREPRQYEFTALFNNRVQEQGVDAPRAAYPFRLRDFLEACDVQDTGTLILPPIGSIRARNLTADRVEDGSEIDVGKVSCSFVEDNEESGASQSFNQPTVRASVVRLSEQTTFSRQRAGALDSDAISLTEFASELESLLLAPGRSVSDLQSKVTASRRAIQRVTDAQVSLARTLGLEHDEPRGSELWRNLARMHDLQAKSADEKFSSRPRVKTFVVDVERTSIFEIAARFKQDAGELLDLNSARDIDPFLMTRGEVIRVFETAPA
jgi:prophage DNA circulation protein